MQFTYLVWKTYSDTPVVGLIFFRNVNKNAGNFQSFTLNYLTLGPAFQRIVTWLGADYATDNSVRLFLLETCLCSAVKSEILRILKILSKCLKKHPLDLILFILYPAQCYHSTYAFISRMVSSLEVFRPKILNTFLLSPMSITSSTTSSYQYYEKNCNHKKFLISWLVFFHFVVCLRGLHSYRT